MEGHDQKETVAFLKNEYGIGGGSGGLPGNDDSIMNMMEKVSVWRKAVMAIRMQKCF